MMVKVYVIRDKISGLYTEPILKINDDVMFRYFRVVCDNSKEASPTDLDLYCIGTYDSDNAIMVPCEPAFILNGGHLYGTSVE